LITIIDYGLGNIQAFLTAFKRLNIDARAATDRRGMQGASKLILPGVGAFDTAMERLEQSGMRESLDELVLGQRVPTLGICVGMQIFATSGDEGKRPGLGWIGGQVRHLRSGDRPQELPLPHMGWNDVRPLHAHPLFAGLDEAARFYFLHSYHFECARPEQRLAVCNHGGDFTCAVQAGNLYGVQFHPEKSHHAGMQLLQNFASL
jgi:glutamine amidotransferase